MAVLKGLGLVYKRKVRTVSSAGFCQNLSTILFLHLAKKKKVIYYVIAVDILAEGAGTLKYASVISKKSQTISLVWFREVAWTAQKAVF